MNFTELHAAIPYAVGGKEKCLTYSPYPNIELALPGRHAEDTTPRGGDFVVRVTDKYNGWKKHEFSHTDIFSMIDTERENEWLPMFLLNYKDIIMGHEPTMIPRDNPKAEAPPRKGDHIFNFDWLTMLYAMQCLSVAEHRRYAQHETQFGGRYLPFRFATGIAEGLWDSVTASAVQRYGRPAVERLEKQHGTPVLTRELMEK